MTIIAEQPGNAEQQINPITARRTAFTAGLRALADILDAHPELELPFDGTASPIGWIPWGDDVPRTCAIFARVMPGTVEKSVSDSAGQFYLNFKLHGLSLRVIASRSEMCERVVVGTREVVVEEPDPKALALVPKVKRTEVVEDVKWECRPVLSGDQPSDGA